MIAAMRVARKRETARDGGDQKSNVAKQWLEWG